MKTTTQASAVGLALVAGLLGGGTTAAAGAQPAEQHSTLAARHHATAGPTSTGGADTALAETSRRRNGCHQPGPYQLPHAGAPVDLQPRHFSARIRHPYWPMRVGTVWQYRESDGRDVQRVRVRVTPRTKIIAGIKARVVRDTVRTDGEVLEDTRDWYAQDRGGSIWYLGENTKEYENGHVVSTEGSWKYGRNGAQAGVILPARAAIGCAYREEYLAGDAEDRAFVLSKRESVRIKGQGYRHVLHTANWTPLDRAILENKFYARGVGPVLELDVSPRPARAVLVKVTRP